MLSIINQIFEISQKMEQNSISIIDRNIKRIFSELEDKGYQIINPINRVYKETDTDVEANIVGELMPSSKIVKVLKPIVYLNKGNDFQLIQKGITIVE